MSEGKNKPSENEDYGLEKFQWTLFVVLLIIREFNTFALDKITDKASLSKDISTKIVSTIYINCQYSFYIAFVIGSKARTETAYCILFADFFINLYQALSIAWMD